MIETRIKLRIPLSLKHIEPAVKLFLLASNSKRFTMEYIVGENESLALEDDGGVNITSTIEILRYLSSFCVITHSLVDVPKREKEILKWIKFSNDMKSAHQAKMLNGVLTTRTYLIGSRLSVADIFVLAKLQVFIEDIKSKIPNLFHFGRWYSNMMTVIRFIPRNPIPFTSMKDYLSNPKPFKYTPTGNPFMAQKGAGKRKGKRVEEEDEGEVQEKKKKKKKKKPKKKQKGPAPLSPCLIDIRVGKVLSVKIHPDLSGTYVEEVDVGAEKPLIICSGLGGKLPMSELENKHVLIMMNLKPRVMKTVTSQGMLLCGTAKSSGKVSLLVVPDCPVGEKIEWENAPAAEPLKEVPGKKLHKMLKKYKSDGQKRVCFDNFVLKTSKGPVLTEEADSIVS